MLNIKKLFNGRNDAIEFVYGYGSMILESKRNAAGEKPEVPTEPEIATKAKIKHKISLSKLREKFLSKIKNEE